MLAALALLTVGGVLVYSAFQTPPDPREVLKEFFTGKGKTKPKATQAERSRRGY